MKITNFKSVQNVTVLADLVKYTDIDLNLFLSTINGGVDLVDNCNTALVSVNFLKANTQYPFTHNLGRVPQGYLSAGMNVSCSVFNGLNPANITQIFLQSSAISSGKVLVF